MTNQHFKELSEGLWRQLNNDALVDAGIVANGKIVKIHKVMLAVFSHHIRETKVDDKGTWKIDAPGYTEVDITNFVKFLYNGDANIEETCQEIIRSLCFDLSVDQRVRRKKISISKGETTQTVVNLELKYLRNLTFEMGIQKLFTDKKVEGLKDVSIRTGKKLHRCHKVILSAMSEYFAVMFMCGLKETQEDIVDLHGVEADIFSAIISYVYTGKSPITVTNVQEMLIASEYLQMKSLQIYCEEFLLQNIDKSNCVDLLRFAEVYNCSKLSSEAMSFIIHNFYHINRMKMVCKLQLHHVVAIAKDDNLNVNSEAEILQFAIDWIKHNKAESFASTILSNVRLTLVNQRNVRKILEEVQVFPNSDDVLELLKSAIENQNSGKIEENPRKEKAITVVKRSPFSSGIELACYSLSRKLWYKLADCPSTEGGSSFAACATANHIYVTGETTSSTHFFQYSVEKNEWLKLEDMCEARNAHCMGYVQGAIYVIGGSCISNGTFNVVESIEKYCFNKKSWFKVGNMTIPAYDAACAVMKTRILIFGGSIGSLSGVYIKDIQCFDTITQTCTTLYHHLPFTTSLAVACVNNRNIYVTCPNGKIVHYNEESSAKVISQANWSKLMGFATVYDNNVLYILGGYSMVGEYDSVLKIDIKTKRQYAFSETKLPFQKQSNQLFAAVMYMTPKHLETEFPTMKVTSPRNQGLRL